MDIREAIELIRIPAIDGTRPQTWCDLGCGSGTFTLALAELLAPGSMIRAVDRDHRALQMIPDQVHGVEIHKIVGDLSDAGTSLPMVDGIVMANSLHFIHKQEELLKRLIRLTDCFVIVEYERSIPSPWGPYPVNFSKLQKLFALVGINHVEKIATSPSRFGGVLYSAFAGFNAGARSASQPG